MQTNTRAAWARRAWSLALIVALAACGGGSSETASAPAQDAPRAASIPQELHGQWETVLAYVPPFYSGPFGSVPQGDGSLGIAFYFWPDGRYQHAWNLAQAYFGGNCFRTASWDEFGTVSEAGGAWMFTPGKAVYSQMDSCGEFKYLDPAPVAPASHTLTLERDNTGWPYLRVSFPTGDLLLEKCRRCQ